MILTFDGPAAGVGNKMTRASENPQVGNGTQEITASAPNERVESAPRFGDMGLNPVGRWMGLMMDGWIGPDFETGLGNLKTLVE